jgi:Immunoglobulin domain
MKVNDSLVEGDVVTSKLVLSRLSPEDSGRRYACQAANNLLQPAPQVHVTVEIILAPIRVEISRTASAFTAGTATNLTCQVLGSNPAPSTALWAGGRQLPTVYQRESADGKIFSIVASFSPGPADDNTFVICRAVNKYFPQEALEDQWKISVLYPPLPKLNYEHPSALPGRQPSSAAVIAQEADRVVLTCRAESNPRPYEYHWRHNGASRALPDPAGLSAGLSSQLVLASVDRADSGNYSCLAENSQAVLPNCKRQNFGRIT